MKDCFITFLSLCESLKCAIKDAKLRALYEEYCDEEAALHYGFKLSYVDQKINRHKAFFGWLLRKGRPATDCIETGHWPITGENMDALTYLMKLIDDGIEYPDAEWKASQRYGVSADDLRNDYDRQFD
jgi:hypothetical protein